MDKCLIPLGDMESRRTMNMDLISCSRRLSKSTLSNVKGKRRKVTLKAFILRRLVKITSTSRTIHSSNMAHT